MRILNSNEYWINGYIGVIWWGLQITGKHCQGHNRPGYWVWNLNTFFQFQFFEPSFTPLSPTWSQTPAPAFHVTPAAAGAIFTQFVNGLIYLFHCQQKKICNLNHQYVWRRWFALCVLEIEHLPPFNINNIFDIRDLSCNFALNCSD